MYITVFSIPISISISICPLDFINTCIYSQVFEDSHLHEKPDLQEMLNILNYVFCIAFTLEMLLKMTGFGITKYFASAWNCLDAFIVAVSSILVVFKCCVKFLFSYEHNNLHVIYLFQHATTRLNSPRPKAIVLTKCELRRVKGNLKPD